MIQPARVLPSNAPPLSDVQGAHHASRVLQEQSGNRQATDYPYLNVDQKYPAELLPENAYGLQQTGHVPQVFRPGLQQRHAWRHAPSRHYNSQENQERNDKYAQHLYRRFRASDQYMKYRTRQSKEDKGGQEQKWPDRLELAFFQALIRWPPMGRRKLLHKDKQRGRNELIADYIEELTGEARTRKQVSSHIQVLKPFVEHDPFIMKWLSKEDFGQGTTSSRYGPYGPSSYNSGRRMSGYPVTNVPHNIRHAGLPVLQTGSLNGLDVSSVKHDIGTFEPLDFSMFVQRKRADGTDDRLHTYTQSIKQPLQQDEHVPDWATFTAEYPHLANMHAHRPLDCNVISAEASLAFPTENWKDKDGVELGISFLCSSRHLPPTAPVACQNSFYRHGQYLREYSSASEVHFSQSQEDKSVETQVKFGSTFWAKTLAHLAARLRDSGGSSSSSTAADASRDPREEVAAHIRGLNATQEVFVVPEHGRQERILVIFWKFRLSSSNCGRASWQRIVLPPPSTSTSLSSASTSSAPPAVVSVGTSEYVSPAKQKRQDSVYDYSVQYPAVPSSQPQQHQAPPVHPVLQSPFEYDGSNGSALPSATWSGLDDGSLTSAPQSAIDFSSGGDNAYDFSGGNMHIAYDTTLDFGFDSSAFNYDATTADFAADPALQDYSTTWCEGFGGNMYDIQSQSQQSQHSQQQAQQQQRQPQQQLRPQPPPPPPQQQQQQYSHQQQQQQQQPPPHTQAISVGTTYAPNMVSCDPQSQHGGVVFDGYGGVSVGSAGGYDAALQQAFHVDANGQAYGGAGPQDGGLVVVGGGGGGGSGRGGGGHDDDAVNSLAVLADASYLASSNLVVAAHHGQ